MNPETDGRCCETLAFPSHFWAIVSDLMLKISDQRWETHMLNIYSKSQFRIQMLNVCLVHNVQNSSQPITGSMLNTPSHLRKQEHSIHRQHGEGQGNSVNVLFSHRRKTFSTVEKVHEHFNHWFLSRWIDTAHPLTHQTELLPSDSRNAVCSERIDLNTLHLLH